MTIETKYNLGDKVFTISNPQVSEYIDCNLCKGSCYVPIGNTERTVPCPDCHGQGRTLKRYKETWKADASIKTVGNVRASLYKYKKSEDRIEYMLEETGVGSGSVWPEDRLFSTLECAREECEKRNLESTND